MSQNGKGYKDGIITVQAPDSNVIAGVLDWSKATSFDNQGTVYLSIPFMFTDYGIKIPGDAARQMPAVSFKIVIRRQGDTLSGALQTTTYGNTMENIETGRSSEANIQTYTGFDNKLINTWKQEAARIKPTYRSYLSEVEIAAIRKAAKDRKGDYAKAAKANVVNGRPNAIAYRPGPDCGIDITKSYYLADCDAKYSDGDPEYNLEGGYEVTCTYVPTYHMDYTDCPPVIISPNNGSGGGTGSNQNPKNPGNYPPDMPENNTTQLTTEILRQQFVNRPFSLFGDIPCSAIKSWLSIAKFTPPQNVVYRVNSIAQTAVVRSGFSGGFMPISYTDVGHIQKLNDAYSQIINMDYFSVKVTKLPKVNGQQLTAPQFLNYLRLNINNFVEDNSFTPYNAYGINDNALWNSSNPVGSIIAIDINGPDNGSVVTSYSGQDKWTFTTIYEPMYGVHPVSGNRNFGYTQNADGSYTFYTRGVDRLTTWDVSDFETLSKLFDDNNTGYPLSKADDLWKSFQAHISDFVTQNSGSAAVQTPETYRPEWQLVKDVIDGKRPLSDLSTDCPDDLFVD